MAVAASRSGEAMGPMGHMGLMFHPHKSHVSHRSHPIARRTCTVLPRDARTPTHHTSSLLAPPDDIVRRKAFFAQQLIPGWQALHAHTAAEFVGDKPKPFLK